MKMTVLNYCIRIIYSRASQNYKNVILHKMFFFCSSRDILELRNLMSEMQRRVDIKPWMIVPPADYEYSEPRKSIDSDMGSSDGGMVSIFHIWTVLTMFCYGEGYTGWLKKHLTLLWRFIFGTEYIKQKIDLLYLTKELISFHKNFISLKSVQKIKFYVEFSKSVNFYDLTGFCGYGI